MSNSEKVIELHEYIQEAKHITVLTGAGISTSAGIPDFISQPGIREKLTRIYAEDNPEEYNSMIDEMKNSIQSGEPTIAHKYIAQLGSKCTVVTQNIDKYHEDCVIDNNQHVYPLHGQIDKDLVLYGDSLDLIILNDAGLAIQNSDLMIVIGTSLQVYPASLLLDFFKGTLVYIDYGEPYIYFNMHIQHNIEDVFKGLTVLRDGTDD